MTATPDPDAPQCQADPDAGAAAVAAGASNITIVTVAAPEASGEPYLVHTQGLTGPGCKGTLLAGCKLQSACEFTETDATDPSNRTATLQFSWTFTKTGFTGLNSGYLPPGPIFPSGCQALARAAAQRR